jgi:hypothetical protein
VFEVALVIVVPPFFAVIWKAVDCPEGSVNGTWALTLFAPDGVLTRPTDGVGVPPSDGSAA